MDLIVDQDACYGHEIKNEPPPNGSVEKRLAERAVFLECSPGTSACYEHFAANAVDRDLLDEAPQHHVGVVALAIVEGRELAQAPTPNQGRHDHPDDDHEESPLRSRYLFQRKVKYKVLPHEAEDEDESELDDPRHRAGEAGGRYRESDEDDVVQQARNQEQVLHGVLLTRVMDECTQRTESVRLVHLYITLSELCQSSAQQDL